MDVVTELWKIKHAQSYIKSIEGRANIEIPVRVFTYNLIALQLAKRTCVCAGMLNICKIFEVMPTAIVHASHLSLLLKHLT